MKPEAGLAGLEGRKTVPSNTDMTDRWSGPEEAERAIRQALRSCFDHSAELRPWPDTLLVSQRVLIFIRRPYMTKRGFRRWRARLKARK